MKFNYVKIKRLFDFFLAMFLLVFISPIFVLIIIFLQIFNKGEIFYLQKRIGQDNGYFHIFKFATMHKDSLQLPGGAITMRNDSRITKTGAFLRLTKLNELPQIFNVLIGDMSFVGPRPLMDEGFSLLSNEAQNILYKSKPGITGISSVIFRDEEILVTNCRMDPRQFYIDKILPYKSKLEIWYYNNKSFGVDLALILLTAIKIILPKNNYVFLFFKSLPKDDFFIK